MARRPQIPNRVQQPKKQVESPDPKIVKIFHEGLSAHQRGQLAQAKAAYEQVLANQPKHFDALHLLGVVAAQTKNPALAVELIEKAIALKPDDAEAFNNRGNALKELKRLDDALLSYDKAIALKPDNADAFNNRGNALRELKRLDDALSSYDKAIALKPDYAEAFNNRGNALQDLKRLDDALSSYDKAIALKPDYAEAFNNRGNALQDLKRLDDALSSYDKAIALKPDYADALNNRGNALKELKRLDDALLSYDKAIALKPDYAEAFNNRGNALQDLKRLDDALSSYDKAIALKPDNADAFYNRGCALRELKRLDEALSSYDKAIALKPDYAEAFNNRGNALKELKRLDDALSSYDKAIALNPDYAEAFNNRGNALKELKRLDDALSSYDKAIALKPDFAEALNNRGNALKELKRLDDALSSYDKAIALKPDYADAFNNRGCTLQELKRLDEALSSYDKAIALKPDYADAFNNRGNALREFKRLDEALSSYDKAIALKPDYEFLWGTKLHTQMHLCDWNDLQNQLERLEVSIAEDKQVTSPFPVLALMDKPDLQMEASRIYARTKFPANSVLGKFNSRPADGKIRIGYYSADFHNHATSLLMAELFEAHDAQKFELYGFSFGPDTQDEMRSRVASGFNHFFDVSRKSDREVVQMSRDLGIDIAVDLKGFTQDCRMGLFAEQCAPIQVNFLGYPGTSAATYFDYIVADRTLIPCESQQYYTEKIIYLPHSYQVNDSKRKISDRVFSRQELGLPESGFVYCCFNNNYKILPETFDVWMRLLKTVNGSVLWLLQSNHTAAKNLRKEAELRGVDPARLVFAPRMKLEDHLARHRAADLFIDTLPCNAHTTASDALWAGLPVLTLMGQSFAARVAASLLNAMDLPELITKTQGEYESKAIELANDPVQLTEIKNKVAQNRQTSPLFKGQLFARHIEAAYTEIHRRHLNGERPDHIYVSANYFQEGLSAHQRGQLAQAKAAYEQVLANQPKHFNALHLLGVVAAQTKNPALAAELIGKAIALKPDFAVAFNNRGCALQDLKRLDEALSSYDKAIALKPDYADAFNNRGNALQDLKRLDDALASYDKAIALKPDYADAFYNRGCALRDLKRLDEALSSYDKAIALKPDYADAFNNRGNALREFKRLDDALSSYDKAIALKPDYEFLWGTKLHTQMHLCDWNDLQNQLERLEVSIAEDKQVTPPFPVLALMDKPDLQMEASRIFARAKYPANSVLGKFNSRPADGKIRIGYYSADFHNHATSFLMAELFEAHDAQKFELYGFSFGPDTQDEMRSRVASGFNHFFDVSRKSDREVAQMSRDLGIDIAVDLKGFTQDCRMGLFAEQCAPIQVNFLGYPGTSAAAYFDYIVADRTLIPCESQQYYTEKIIYLPHSYQVNDSKRKISDRVFSRQELGLPESGFVYCCFNNNYKILPETFDVWMRLLKTVNGSVLWLLQDNHTAAKNLRKEAELRGVDPARLVFAPRMKLEDHLARHRAADLFIDTLPYNAHTTASDALWAGLPVLTLMGQSFAARVAASLLNAMDLPELITKTQGEYESKAIELANDPVQLTEIKNKVAQNRQTSPLFKGQLFARHIEAAYTEIHRRHLNGERPDHIYV